MKREIEFLYYILITGTVFLAHAMSGFLEQMVVAGDKIAWVYLFAWYTIWIAMGDKLIQKYIFNNKHIG